MVVVPEATVVAVESAPAMPPGVRGVRHDRDGQDGENEEERADHTALRSPRGCTSWMQHSRAGVART